MTQTEVYNKTNTIKTQIQCCFYVVPTLYCIHVWANDTTQLVAYTGHTNTKPITCIMTNVFMKTSFLLAQENHELAIVFRVRCGSPDC